VITDKRKLQQFEFIEFILAFEGIITNRRLREQFDIAIVQASRVLAAYRQTFPRNIDVVAGEGRGRYCITSRFTPRVAKLHVDRYFELVSGKDEGVRKEIVRYDLTNIAPEKFRVLNYAIANNSAVWLSYRSMNHPDGKPRIIHPLTFVFAGRRWHVRAFDEETKSHRDFNLSRIGELVSGTKSIDTPEDSEWNEQVSLLLKPHPKLTPAQNQLIRDELFEGASSRLITTRKALVQYMLRELEVATEPEIQLPPEFQIYLHRIE
jgi:hypothetical protein